MIRSTARLLSSAVIALAAGGAMAQLFGPGLAGVAQESTQRIQWAFQAADRALALARQAQQLENEARMLEMGAFNSARSIWASIDAVRIGSTGVNRVIWDASRVSADFEQLYPVGLGRLTMPELTTLRWEQAWLSREASRNSKISSASIVEEIVNTSERILILLDESKSCSGQTCALDLNSQTSALAAETQIQNTLLLATHNRAIEGLTDYIIGGEERARMLKAEFRRGLRSGEALTTQIHLQEGASR